MEITGGTLSLYPSSERAEIAPKPKIATKALCMDDSSAFIASSLSIIFFESFAGGPSTLSDESMLVCDRTLFCSSRYSFLSWS